MFLSTDDFCLHEKFQKDGKQRQLLSFFCFIIIQQKERMEKNWNHHSILIVLMMFLLSLVSQLRTVNSFLLRTTPPSTRVILSPSCHSPSYSYYSSTTLAARTHFRADRVLANRTGKTRSQCFQLLQDKRIWQKISNENEDNNETNTTFQLVKGPAEQLSMNASLYVDRTHAIPMPPPLLQVYCKPKWVLSVRHDPMDRPCIAHILTALHPVGRLDYDTTGLLLFSTSGTLTQQLLHPKHAIEKEYVATVTGTVQEELLKQQLQEGVVTSEGVHTATLLHVEHWEADAVSPYLQQVQAAVPLHYNQTDLKANGHWRIFEAKELSTVRLTVQEGKYRMVRRILANCGHEVVDLKRERVGNIQLGDLLPGQVRDLTADELQWAEQILSGTYKSNNKPKYIPKRLRKDAVVGE